MAAEGDGPEGTRTTISMVTEIEVILLFLGAWMIPEISCPCGNTWGKTLLECTIAFGIGHDQYDGH